MWSHGVLEYIGYIDLLKGSPNGFNVQSSTNILYVVGVVEAMGVVEPLLQSSS